MAYASSFKTHAGETAYRAAYDAAMKLWPVSCEEMEIATRFGMTHVVVSGPQHAPPLVLLHGYMATLAMWLTELAGTVDVKLWPVREGQVREGRETGNFVCSGLDDGRPCDAEAFARVWRSERPDDVFNYCLRHAHQEESVFLVEPICRKDFYSAEYESLLEKSLVGRQLSLAS